MQTLTSQNEKKKDYSLATQYSSISVLGLGYVGLPLLLELSKYYKLVGLDVDKTKISELQNGIDRTSETSSVDLKKTSASFTTKVSDIYGSNIKIVTVPTPIDSNNKPDLTLLKKATTMLAGHIKKDDIIVYESTVYPGVTEEVCAPIIEDVTGLKLNQGFFLGYSPERLSPGDSAHSLTKIVKVVAGSTPQTCDILAHIYGSIIPAGIHKASSIKVAEAAKVIENTQRDLNVALMNELSIIFNKMKINTLEVIEAASTKWNFMKMTPGLVGGHCIGVDPYYLTYKAEQLGHHPDVILAGRRINDGMGKYIANEMIKLLVRGDIPIRNSRIGIFGLTFKENVSDIRNSKVVDIINELTEFGVKTFIHDPHALCHEVLEEYNLTLTSLEDMNNLDGIIIAVAHDEYKKLSYNEFKNRISRSNTVIFDVKNIFYLKNYMGVYSL